MNDQSLCLTCSASLPPRRKQQQRGQGECFMTKCCTRPICPRCLDTNPRLSRYYPCLACLAGVSAVASSTRSNGKRAFRDPISCNPDGNSFSSTRHAEAYARPDVNVDGSLQDGDLFIVGDDDDNERSADNSGRSNTPPPPYPDSTLAVSHEPPQTSRTTTTGTRPTDSDEESNNTKDSIKQHVIQEPEDGTILVRKTDTLVGLALKYGVDARSLCRLNGLPPTTLSTTPHLLHTRTTLKLLPSAKPRSPHANCDTPTDGDKRASRTTERAAKKIQTVAKETDWSVAKVYADLASTPLTSTEAQLMEMKRKELGGPSSVGGVEDRALDAYMEDEEWEARERKLGRAPRSLLASADIGTKDRGLSSGK